MILVQKANSLFCENKTEDQKTLKGIAKFS